MDIYVDGWVDPFLHTFSAWPERFYVFQYHQSEDWSGWQLRWWNMPHPIEGHRIDDIRDWLELSVPRPVGVPPPLVRTTSQALQEQTQMAKVKEAFDFYDEEKNGVIGRDQMYGLLHRIGFRRDAVKAAFLEVDLDHSGAVDLEEFEAFFRSIQGKLSEQLMKQEKLHHVGGPVERRRFVA